MKILRFAAPLVVAGLLAAGCGQADIPVPVVQAEPVTTTTTIAPTTTTVPAPTTTTTACVTTDTSALRSYIDSVGVSIRQTEGAVAQIQLVIDNGGRQRESALRYQASVQADYDEAAAAANLLGLDSAHEKVAYQQRRLDDAKGIVASWDALLAKAQGDLGRAKAQKADFERKVREATAQLQSAPSC